MLKEQVYYVEKFGDTFLLFHNTIHAMILRVFNLLIADVLYILYFALTFYSCNYCFHILFLLVLVFKTMIANNNYHVPLADVMLSSIAVS